MKEKVVFISHSSADFAFANKLCTVFENQGLYCWIAPRDIPYGDDWPEKITEAVEAAKVMLFVYTEHSNKSKQVVNEINLALRNGVTIIPIHLTDQAYNKSLQYLISTKQWVPMDKENEESCILDLANRVNRYLYGTEEISHHTDVSEMEEEDDGFIDVDINVDDELDAKFDDLFGNPEREDEEKEVSPFKKKLLDRICERFVESTIPPQKSEEDEEEEECTEDAEIEESTGKYFSLNEQDSISQIFLVRRKIQEIGHAQQFVPELLERTETELEDGNKKVTYYVEDPDEEGNPFCMISFLRDREMVLTNMGFLDGDVVSISKKPMPMEFQIVFGKKEEKIKKFRANENGKVMIDPETGEVVPRQRYYDKVHKEWKYYVELAPYKKYFAFELRTDTVNKGKDKEQTASPYYVAYGYYKGHYGLEKNILKAAEWFEKAATKKAYFYLAQIFKEDPLLSNEEDYNYYMELYEKTEEDLA